MDTIQLTQNQRDDVYFITHPDKGQGYPHWPYVPLKRSTPEGQEFAFLIDRNPLGKPVDNAHECFRTLYLKSLLQYADEVKKGGYESDLRAQPKKVYNSVEEMIADGWMVY